MRAHKNYVLLDLDLRKFKLAKGKCQMINF